MNIQELYQVFLSNPIIDTDSRSIQKNSLFFALKGENFNGNLFAENALKNGASIAVVDENLFPSNPTIILFDDVLKTLQELANYHRKKLKIPIIALTGSNGKTTTKELINAVLSTTYKTIATKGNLNNHIGVPLTLLSITDETEIAIVEMGANHQKEIAFLCAIAEPNYGYITNFGKAHLEGFGGVEGVIKGKSELYNHLRSSNGMAFINIGDEIQFRQSLGMKTVSFEIGIDAIEFVEANPFVKIQYNNTVIQSQLIGQYNVNNMAAAISIGEFFKISDINIKFALENYVPSNHRSQLMKIGSNTIFMDAYNANPSSMKVALENFNQIDGTSKIVILGDMFELGDSSMEEHQAIADLVANCTFDKVFLIGNHFSKTAIKKAKQFSDFEQFNNEFDYTSIQNSTILLKGSRGMALERILELLK